MSLEIERYSGELRNLRTYRGNNWFVKFAETRKAVTELEVENNCLRISLKIKEEVIDKLGESYNLLFCKLTGFKDEVWRLRKKISSRPAPGQVVPIPDPAKYESLQKENDSLKKQIDALEFVTKTLVKLI